MNVKKAGVVYGAAAATAAAVSYFRGRRGMDIARDAAVHGFVAGTGIVAAGYALDVVGVAVPVLSNPSDHVGMGALSKKAVALLSQVPAQKVFAPGKKNGVKIAPVPADEMSVEQDEV